MSTTTPTDLANVPHPAGATHVGEWDPFATTATTSRYFTGSSWVVNRPDRDSDTLVLVDGTQHADGRIDRLVSLDDDDLTSELARQLGEALIAAADEVEQMAGYDRIEVTR
jgi:hypothetical protein